MKHSFTQMANAAISLSEKEQTSNVGRAIKFKEKF